MVITLRALRTDREGSFRKLLVFLFLLSGWYTAFSQCNALSSRRDIFFTPSFGCAPTTVSRFEITYYFTVPQNPVDIQIRYTWNDPGGNTTTIDLGSGLVAGAGNTSFTANATFTYVTNNGQCSIRPTVVLIVNGVACPTSTQMQTAPFWGTDDQANGVVSMAPATWDVCFNNPVINARFRDNSDFNCNIAVEPDNPNRLTRNVQFVYGTNHNPAATILNLSLTNGGPQPLTNGAGNLVTPQTHGTAGLLVTGGYFGPVDVVPFPADNPTSVSFPMNAPTNAANLIGNRFEITMFNWNACNPWNGDSVNPNYEDALMTTGYIVIVAAPTPNFDTQDNMGVSKRDFCINETIYLANLTPSVGSYSYTWEFYDNVAGTVLLSTSNATNPTFAYSTGGTKLIRLKASNPTAQGSCVNTFDLQVNITPTLIAKIGVTDFSNVPITPYFCQQASGPLTSFPVRFTDTSVGTTTATTQWRWEFRDQNNVLYLEAPTAGAFSNTMLGPFDLTFANPGIYHARLITRDQITGCSTFDDVEVRVYEKPVPIFTADRVCQGTATTFAEASTLTSINGESIVLKEWDFNYNGSVFTKDPAFDNQTAFTRPLGAAATYQVALRVTTDQNACSDIYIIPVTVNAIPLATFSPDVIAGCSILTVNFTNTSITGQPDIIDQYVWEADNGSGFTAIGTQRPTDPGFSAQFSYPFENIGAINETFDVRLHVFTVNGCESVSPATTITVFPGTASGFISINYSPFNDNCSPVSVDFVVDRQTQSLNPTDYTWIISDVGGVISSTSTGTAPRFTGVFTNTTNALKDFSVKLHTTLSSGCFGDSTRTIRVSPIPSSQFTVDTLVFDCQIMRVRLSAVQKGLSQYHWVIQEDAVTVSDATSQDDEIEYQVNRPASVFNDVAMTVKLDTRNLANCVSNVSVINWVVPKQDDINASFTATPAFQTLPNSTVTINNTTHAGPWQFLWDFGDGTSSTASDPTISHTYATYGHYLITLTVSMGVCVQTQTQAVVIDAIPPTVDFAYDPPAGCVPVTVKFTNLSNYADPSTYVWDFGDGNTTSNAVNPTYTYNQPGVYTVSLSASNITGEVITTTKSMIISAFARPLADFAVKPELLYIPGDILYTSNRSINGTTFLWDFGDGITSSEVQPTHIYKTEGAFDITLIAYTVNNCSDTAVHKAAVHVQKGGQVLIPNAFSPNTASGGSSNGKNDIFLPLLRGVTEFELLVFNRWGELLFESHDQNTGWDGYYRGQLCAQDVYVYRLTALYENGDKTVRVGDINLIR